MTNSQQILVIPESFKVARNEFKNLISELEKAEQKITSVNNNLIAAWEGESGSEFSKQAAIVEEIFSKDVQSLKEILDAKLQYALVNIENQDRFISKMINGNNNILNNKTNVTDDNWVITKGGN